MKVEQSIGRHRIGAWDFTPASGELRRRSDLRRLEPRAAKALQLLCDADGEVVSHERLIDAVWGGRTLSDNSVAVVIGQLRRALDDDPRQPQIIQTIPKRGYRLVRRPGTFIAAKRPRLWGGLLMVLVLLTAAALMWSRGDRSRDAVAVGVSAVTNETGDRSYDPLARASTALIVDQLSKRGFEVRRGGGDLTIASKLVMWDGAPFLGMTATDDAGVVRWSAMIRARPGEVPPGVQREFDKLKARVADDGAHR